MAQLGILFDPDDLGIVYRKAAYQILFSVLGPNLLRGCSLSDGDLIVNGRYLYCIAVECENFPVLDSLPGFSVPRTYALAKAKPKPGQEYLKILPLLALQTCADVIPYFSSYRKK